MPNPTLSEPIRTTDYHTAGEPFRIVAETPPLSAPTVADKRLEAMADPAVDGLRRLLCSEPRGHADMYGGFITAPDDPGAHFGVLFWHADGFSIACGHGTIALGTWAVETGRVPVGAGGTTDVVIDVPSGRVTARVSTDADGRVASAAFVNVPSVHLHSGVEVHTGAGTVPVSISSGGALYASVDATAFGLLVVPENLPESIALGREIKAALDGTEFARHPEDARLSGIYGVIFVEHLGFEDDGSPVQRNVTVFADGQVDRSPCGSGTAARMATLAAEGVLHLGNRFVHESVVGTRFIGRILEETSAHGLEAIVPEVTGSAHRTGEHTFTVDRTDPLVPGFVLR
ncbi:proline racemase family protein [Nocardia zapadnayensis]|nr:proline racemase family protein [Nocardia zapadnayensis]MCX0276964.1 proline racemase family protein [Nocardia zapadnayensis]